ncbi:autophagy protein Apg9-domain-containing protein [Collybia nuda]|uniref:Autophagy-related protein 9 n=1 Tax=Collybia nuda TaxID=64659 RepID=A0A9P6C8I1_9AGAR|nr:autophagy protein Apg9-domain-containing protein [Collybia nuda]
MVWTRAKRLPFIVLYLLMYLFFRYFEVGPHLKFVQQLDESYPLASIFVAFIAGSFAAVLVLAAVLDPHFEVSPDCTVVFYLGVFGAILAMLMTEVIAYTHYMPDEWKEQLHSKKILIFVQEVVSVVLTPFVLWFSLPTCAPAIIDFFREFLVHVDGRGYVCSFAKLNFERHGNVKFGAPMQTKDKKMISNKGKMEKSFLNFKATNPDWNLSNPSSSLYLSQMADFGIATHMHTFGCRRAAANLEATVHFAGKTKGKGSVMDKAQVYNQALRQSQHAATRRRLPGGSTMGMSSLGPGPSSSSIFGGYSTTQTAVLGDSQGSNSGLETLIPAEELELDGGLGESYVDGGK